MGRPEPQGSVTAHTRPPAALRLVTAKRHEALHLLQNPLPHRSATMPRHAAPNTQISAADPDRSPLTARHDESWRRLLSPGLRRHLTDCGQDELTALSSNHLHVVALRSDHFVQRFDGQPDVVIRAVQAVVRAARDHTCRPPRRLLFRRRPRLAAAAGWDGHIVLDAEAAGQWGVGHGCGQPLIGNQQDGMVNTKS